MEVTQKVGNPRKKLCEWSITVDTREQRPWLFRKLKTRTWEFIVPASRGTLKQGDYAITGLESELVIERKSLEDLYATVISGRDRFERELERITDCCRQGVVVVEAPWSVIAAPEHYRTNWRSRARPQSVIGSIQALTIRYPKVHWMCMPTRDDAEWTAFQLLRFAYARWADQFKQETEEHGEEDQSGTPGT